MDVKTKHKPKSRVDAQINKGKIARDLLKNPLKTQRQIAQETWLGKTTVQQHLKEMNLTKDDRILTITKKDIEIVNLWQKELLRRLKDTPKIMWTRDIVAAMDTSTKRYTIFKWDITDPSGWLKAQITDEQRKKLLDRLNFDIW